MRYVTYAALLSVLLYPTAHAQAGEQLAGDSKSPCTSASVCDDCVSCESAWLSHGDCGCETGCESSAAWAGVCGPGCGCGAASPWSFYGDGLLLDRNAPRDRTIVANVPLLDTRMSASDLDFDMELGIRVGAVWRPGACGGNCGVSWDLAYLGQRWTTGARAISITGPTEISAGPGDAFNWANDIRVTYGSDLDSFEVNRVSRVTPCLSWLVGARIMTLDETFRLVSIDDNGFGFTGGTATGRYDIHTDNDLFGGQIGLQRDLPCINGLQLSGILKAGVYYVDSQYAVDFQDEGNFPNQPVSYVAGDEDVAFVGEIDLRAVYALSCCWSVRSGIQLLWVEGVALAPEQYQMDYADITPATPINRGGGFCAYGGYMGLEAAW